MSGFLLDTNIPSEFRHPRPEPRVVKWHDFIDENSVFISVFTLGELRKGCELLAVGKRRAELEQWLDVEVKDWFAAHDGSNCGALGTPRANTSAAWSTTKHY